MNNTYIIRKDSLNEALDDMSAFEDKMKKFIARHENFAYELSLDNEGDEWIVKINIQNKNEQDHPEVFKDVIKRR